jgi:hypothetical protein
MRPGKTLLFVLLIALNLGCEKGIDFTPHTATTDLLVVQGVLTNEKIPHLIRITHTYTLSNGTAQPVSGAVVSLSDGNTHFTVTENPAGSGLYFTDTLVAVAGVMYQLTIQYGGKQYVAEDRSVPVEPMNPIVYQSVGDSGRFKLDFGTSGTLPNYVEYDLHWETMPACTTPGKCAGEMIYYDLKTIDVNEIYKPAQAEFDFPSGTTIVRRKFSVSSAYQTFLRGILSETEWRGGLFDVEKANAPTNFSPGALGFFAVSTVLSDTTKIQ